MKTIKWIIAVGVLAVAATAEAVPWLGLRNNAGQNSETITLSQVFDPYYLKIWANTDGYKVQGLQYYIFTTPGDIITYGTTPLTALGTPFVTTDLTSNGHMPVVGTTVNSSSDAYTLWYHSSDYNAFGEQSIGTYQFNVSSLGVGTYVFTPDFSEYGAPGGQLSNGLSQDPPFATPGSFVLTVAAVPEPGTWALLTLGLSGVMTRRRRC